MADKMRGGGKTGRNHRAIVSRRFSGLTQRRYQIRKCTKNKDAANNENFRAKNFFRYLPSWIEAIAAVVIVGVTIALFRVAEQQRDVADSANKILKTQTQIMEAINRPSVYFGNIRLTQDKTGGAGTVYGVSVVITNGGNLPAQKMEARLKCTYQSLGDTTDPFEGPVSDVGTSVLGAGQSVARQVCILPEEVYETTKDRTIATFIVGEVTYRSVINPATRRITRMVQRIFIDSGNRYSFRTFGPNNCTDSDCP